MGKDWDRLWAVGFSDTGYTDGESVRCARATGATATPVVEHAEGTSAVLTAVSVQHQTLTKLQPTVTVPCSSGTKRGDRGSSVS